MSKASDDENTYSEKIDRQFKAFYGDTALNGSLIALEAGYKYFGPGHIVFGTDYPFGGETRVKVSLETIEELKAPKSEKRMIMGENAARLLKL